jgi:hypothetical protein
MEPDSVGALIPKIVLPYLRQWADHSGFEVLSKLLVDDQFLSLLARYGDQFIPQPKPENVRRHMNGKAGTDGNGTWRSQRAAGDPPFQSSHDPHPQQADLGQLHARVSAMEGQLRAQQAMMQTLRAKIRPLASALGCCPECVVGIAQCPTCSGKSEVGYFDPDRELLRALVLDPLEARGVSLSVGGESARRPRRRAQDGSTKKQRSSKRV